MAVAIDEIIESIVQVIVEELSPVQIILFGSQARGDATPHSDFDFLIVQDQSFTPENSRKKQMAKLWRRLAYEPASQDFLIYTPDEIAYHKTNANHIVARALKEGHVVYERQ